MSHKNRNEPKSATSAQIIAAFKAMVDCLDETDNYQWLKDRALAYAEKIQDDSDKWRKDAKATLVHLDLSDSQITDTGLVHLKGLKNLTDLGLFNTQITDAGLLHFKGLTKLEMLYLANTDDYPTDTKITDAGVAELQKALPDCKILR